MKDALKPVKAGNYRMMFVPKVDRAREAVKANGGDPEKDTDAVLVEYDRLGGLVLDAEGKKMPYKFFVNAAEAKKSKKAKTNEDDKPETKKRGAAKTAKGKAE